MRVGSVRFCTIFSISTLRHVTIQTSLDFFLVRFRHKALGRDQERIMFSPEIPDSVSANKTGNKNRIQIFRSFVVVVMNSIW